MEQTDRPHFVRQAMSRGACTAVGLLFGCQAYQPSPLDLAAHRDAVDARLTNPEPIAAFAERLAAGGAPAPESFDPTDGLTLAEGEVVALFANPSLRLARMEMGVSLAAAEYAGLWADPVFGFDGAEILSTADPFEYGLVLGVTIPISGRLGVERDRAEAAYDADVRRVVDAEWALRARVRATWSAWSASRQREDLLRGLIGRVERASAVTDRLEAAGELTRVEARLVRSELVELRGAQVKAAADSERLRLALLGLMGLAPDVEVSLVPGVFSAPPTDYPDAVSRLIEANTTLAVRRAEYRTAEEALRLEVRKQYPDVTIGGGLGSENDERLLLGFSIPVPILNANRGGIAEALARRELARGVAQTTFEALSRELAAAQATRDGAARQLEVLKRDLVPMLDDQATEIERLAELGEVNTLVMLETVTRNYEAKSGMLDLRVEQVKAEIEIARLLGPDESMSPAPVGSDVGDLSASTSNTGGAG